MPSANIKTDYGAKGDGQKTTRTVTATSGSKNVSVTVDLFSSPGDVGKYLAIGAQGTALIYDTIASVSDPQNIVLTNNSPATIAGLSKTVEFGTNDSTAFTNFKNAYQGQTGVILNMPDGRYCFAASGLGIGPGFGITGLQIIGASPAGVWLSDMLGSGRGFFLGGCIVGQRNDNAHSARIASVAARNNTLTLLNAGDASKFSVNSWALLTGLDLQAFGNPTNQKFNEYVYITGISSATITLQSPILRSYRSTWPLWFAGGEFTVDQGGPATLYALESGWDCDHEYIDINLDQYLQTNSVGRNVVYTRGSSTGFGIYPTRQKQWTATNYDASGMATAEMDKISEVVSINGGTWHGIKVQSGSPNLLEMNGVHVTTQMNGTPRRAVMTNCTIDPQMIVGPISYGNADQLVVDTCAFNDGFAGGGVSEPDVTGVGAYTMANGIIQRAKAAGTGAPPQWANPGGWCFFSSRFRAESLFQVGDVYEDGTTIFIATNLTGGFPSPISPATAISILTHPCPDTTFINCSGSDEALSYSAIGARKPMHGGWGLTYSGNIGTTKAALKIFGLVSSVKVTVGSGYSAGTFNLDGPFVLQKPNNSVLIWNPVFDLTATGIRTITSAGVTGTSGTDSGLVLPGTGNIWLVANQITPKMSGAVGGGTVTLEINLDQGIIPPFAAPLRLRLHA